MTHIPSEPHCRFQQQLRRNTRHDVYINRKNFLGISLNEPHIVNTGIATVNGHQSAVYQTYTSNTVSFLHLSYVSMGCLEIDTKVQGCHYYRVGYIPCSSKELVEVTADEGGTRGLHKWSLLVIITVAFNLISKLVISIKRNLI